MAQENVMTDSIEHEVVIKAPVAVVWALVTQPEHVAQWYAFDGADIELRPGGRLAFRWREHGEFPGPGGKRGAATPVCVPFRRPCP